MTIITISGDPGSGKSTLAKQLAKYLKMPHFSGGDIFRNAAKGQGMSVAEFTRIAEQDPDVWDKKIDPYQTKLKKKHPSFVIDSRLGFHFLPKSIKIYVRCESKVAAWRLHAQKRKEERWKTAEHGSQMLKRRQASERKRYLKLYGVDHTDLSYFDCVIDSTDITANRKFDVAVDFLKKQGVTPEKTL